MPQRSADPNPLAAWRRRREAGPVSATSVPRAPRSLICARTVDVFRFDLAAIPEIPAPAAVSGGGAVVVVGPGDARSSRQAVAALRDWDGWAAVRLERGAEALCIVVDDELAHVTWMARSKRAKKAFDTLPYPIAFGNGEACTGGILTTPRWRGRGLAAWGVASAHRHLRDAGRTATITAIDVDNAPSLRLHVRFAPTRIARLRSLRLFGLEVGFKVAVPG